MRERKPFLLEKGARIEVRTPHANGRVEDVEVFLATGIVEV